MTKNEQHENRVIIDTIPDIALQYIFVAACSGWVTWTLLQTKEQIKNLRERVEELEQKEKVEQQEKKELAVDPIHHLCDPSIILLRDRARGIYYDHKLTVKRKHNDLQNLLMGEIDACEGVREERKLLVNMVNAWLDMFERELN